MKIYIRSAKDILGMASDRQHALAVLNNHADTYLEHVLKCVVYGNSTGDYRHWIHDEICDYLSIVNRVSVKQGNKKLKAKDYIEYFFRPAWSDKSDMELLLRNFRTSIKKSKQYPDFIVDSYSMNRLYFVLKSIEEVTLPILCKKNDYDIEDFFKLVYPIFENLR